MLTEIDQTKYAVKIAGQFVQTNLPSRQLAEAFLLTLPQDQRAIAEVVPMTADGKTVLFG